MEQLVDASLISEPSILFTFSQCYLLVPRALADAPIKPSRAARLPLAAVGNR
jgi:hypothetical protein